MFVTLGDTPAAVDAPKLLPGEKPQQTYKVGEGIQLGDMVLTDNGASGVASDQFNKPDPDMKFIVVDVTLENKAAKAVNVSSLIQMAIKDETGQI